MKKALFAAVLAMGVMTAARAELVMNGGFETGNFDGWTLSGNTNFTGVSIFDAHTGTYGGYFGAVGSPTTLSQTLDTVAGASYELSYWLRTDSGVPNSFSVSVGGSDLYATTDLPGSPFKKYVFDFVATSASTALTFNLRHDPNYFSFDDVSVVNTASVPEPTTSALLGLSALAFIAARRRKQ